MIKIALMGTRPDGTPDENAHHWIAGHPLKTNGEHSAIEKDQRGITRGSQDAGGASWPFVIPNDTGKEKLVMSFTTSLTFPTIVAAWRWRNAFSSLTPANWPHPITGDAIMRFELPDGTFEDVRLYNVLLSKPTMGSNGVDIRCDYQLQGGRIEDHFTGELAIPVATTNIDTAAVLTLFGTKTGGDFTSDASPGTDTLGAMPAAYRLWIDVDEDVGAVGPYEAKFYVRASGGGSVAGHTSIDSPLTSSFAAILAALDADYVTGEIATVDGRSALRLTCVNVGGGGTTNTRIRVRVNEFDAGTFILYDGEIYGGVQAFDSIPVDGNGDIPVASIAA